MDDLTLYQFASSHYNEKARWGLDWKGVAHRRISLMPGPHAPRMKRLTGRTKTPVLVDADRVVPGSAAILAHLEQRFPDPPLLPSDPDQRARALAIAARFDEEVGPAVRLAKFYEVLSRDYVLRVFCADQTPLARALYSAGFPVIKRVMMASMSINAENAKRDLGRVAEALDFVAREPGPTGYLVGDGFTIADLTCAALLMPAVEVGDLGGPPSAGTEAEASWLARWADHPGAKWVRDIYRRHRTH